MLTDESGVDQNTPSSHECDQSSVMADADESFFGNSQTEDYNGGFSRDDTGQVQAIKLRGVMNLISL